MSGGFIWYELVTPDAAGSKAFYEAVVPGWMFASGPPEANGYGFIALPDGQMAGGVLTMSEEMKAKGGHPGWLGYVHVDDCDAAVAAATKAGAQVYMPANDIPMAGRVACLGDPDGAAFYVMTPTPPPGGGQSTVFSAMPSPGRFGWNELLAGDLDRSIGFYTGLLGWTLPPPMDMGEMGPYQFIAHDGVTIGAIMRQPPQVPRAAWSHYIWVQSVDAAIVAIGPAGGRIVNGPHEVPGGLFVVHGIDPQGAMFALVGNK